MSDRAGLAAALTYARATERDLEPVLDLLRRNRLPEAGVADHIRSALVAKDGNRVVGSAALELYGSSALLRSVAVEEHLRGHGVGQRLIREALELARHHGARMVYLFTQTAAPFFARLGFTAIERGAVDPAVQQSVEFRSACPVSAVCMVLQLPASRVANQSAVV